MHTWKAHLFSFQMMYKSHFLTDPYDWFCGPGPHTGYNVALMDII